MSRSPLLRGVSACALTLVIVTDAFAQQSLPTIEIGASLRRSASVPSLELVPVV